MVKKWVDVNDVWPVYSLTDDRDLPASQYARVDFTDEQLVEYDRIVGEYQAVQDYLEALTEAHREAVARTR